MLKPKHVSSYTTAINEVVTDFIEKVDWLRTTKGNGVMVHDVAGELYKFAFEGKTASKPICITKKKKFCEYTFIIVLQLNNLNRLNIN